MCARRGNASCLGAYLLLGTHLPVLKLVDVLLDITQPRNKRYIDHAFIRLL